MKKTGRNDPCPCGSGKKYKKCCLLNAMAKVSGIVDFDWKKLRKTDDKLNSKLFAYFIKEYPDLLPFSWAEFHGFDEYEDYDEDIPEMDHEDPIFICAFMPWAFYNWVPNELDEGIHTDLTCTIAEAYLSRYSHNLSRLEKDFMSENLKSFYSCYEVLSVIPGQSVRVKDIFRNLEFIVNEKMGSQCLKVGDVAFSRVITIKDCSIFVGMYPSALPSQFISTAISFKQHFYDVDLTDEDLFDSEMDIRELFINSVERFQNPEMPKFQNTDGDALVPSKLIFDLQCSIDKALEKLLTLGSPEETKDEILEEAIYNEDGEISEVSFPWLVSGNKVNKSWDNTVFAHMTLTDKKLTVEVNSTERSEKAKEDISALMGDMAKYKTTVIESLEAKLNGPSENKNQLDINDNPEIKAKLKEIHDRHWHDWLDMNIKALNEQTPREAAKTKEGKERLEALFSDFHQRNLKIEDSDFNQPPVDLAFLRESLGMT